LNPKLVTFDCALTLVKVPQGWSIGAFAADCARHVGLSPTAQDAELYRSMYKQRLPEFVAVNMSRDAARQEAFWYDLASDWLASTEMPMNSLEAMQEAAQELGFGPNSILFELYDDVIPCLDALDAMGIRAAVVSNWDYSLHRVLRMFGIYERFVSVKASLEEGVEKPDPRLFEIALAEAGYRPEDVLHVGDDPTDDLHGALAAGIRGVLIDRSLAQSKRPTIRSLSELPEAFAWID